MRELVYVSTAKLRQFERHELGGGRLRRVREFGAKSPIGEVRVELSGETARSGLDQVLRYLETSDRPARWYTDDGLAPGQWVQFEARLNYRVVRDWGRRKQSAALIFWEPAHASGPRLVLHGSPGHLVGADSSALDEPIGLPISHAAELADLLDLRTGKSLSQELRSLLSDLDRRSPAELAAWMAGYARVTADLTVVDSLTPPTRAVVASPLYVEYTSAPEPD